MKNSGIDLEEDIADHLYQQYGKGAIKILELIKEDSSLKEKIIEDNYFIVGEFLYILRNELTPHLIDVFCRRTEIYLWIDHRKAPEAAEKVAEIMANEYSWDDDQKNKEIQNYLNYISKTVSFL